MACSGGFPCPQPQPPWYWDYRCTPSGLASQGILLLTILKALAFLLPKCFSYCFCYHLAMIHMQLFLVQSGRPACLCYNPLSLQDFSGASRLQKERAEACDCSDSQFLRLTILKCLPLIDALFLSVGYESHSNTNVCIHPLNSQYILRIKSWIIDTRGHIGKGFSCPVLQLPTHSQRQPTVQEFHLLCFFFNFY